MKILVTLFALSLGFLAPSKQPSPNSESCDIEYFFKKVDTDGSYSYDGSEVRKCEYVLVKTAMKTGTYDVTLHRIGQDFYEIQGTSFVLKTSYCYEYATYDKAIVKVTSSYSGYNGGTVFFDVD